MSKRCGWVKINNPLYVAYHDEEWGRPLHDDQALFELLCLETYQAGLSWETVLNKRQAFREAFHGYHLQGVADMTDEELEALLDNPAIIRNRAKIFATRANAQAFLQVQSLAPLMPIFGLLSMGKPSSMMFQITGRLQRRQLFLRSYPRISKNVVLSSPDQSQFYPSYRQQGWLMTTRMIVNGKTVVS